MEKSKQVPIEGIFFPSLFARSEDPGKLHPLSLTGPDNQTKLKHPSFHAVCPLYDLPRDLALNAPPSCYQLTLQESVVNGQLVGG